MINIKYALNYGKTQLKNPTYSLFNSHLEGHKSSKLDVLESPNLKDHEFPRRDRKIQNVSSPITPLDPPVTPREFELEQIQSSPSPSIDSECLLMHQLNVTRTFLYTHPDFELSDEQWKQYQNLISERMRGVPIAYLTGNKEFWSLSLDVTSDTLIPRPETEQLVELALELINKQQATILDLGTGSGAIALAIASEKPNWHVTACDVSQATLNIATCNATQLGLSNVTLRCSDWFSNLPACQYDAIISNPPYIAENDNHLFEGDIRFEPLRALVSGIDGLDALRHIINNGKYYLKPGGLLLLEHGYSQKQPVLDLLFNAGYEQTQNWKDAQGHERITGGWLKK